MSTKTKKVPSCCEGFELELASLEYEHTNAIAWVDDPTITEEQRSEFKRILKEYPARKNELDFNYRRHRESAGHPKS